ncbi:MAG: hypothetical protein E6I53_13815 [Chloroflexi bacterium]|nr:MAG: hypothetical protein E6I71_13940 [Chloroflexota bacterium]TME50188.1 MAG: hypothetical protein E6I53_13815 [Chloroflexota bacterium]
MSSGPPGENPPPPDSLPPPPPQPYQPGVGQPTPYAPPGVVADAQYAMPAMVLGILSLCLLPLACFCGIGELIVIPLGIVAVVLGFMARNKIAASQGTLGGSGKALAAIITGGTGLGIAIILGVAILLFGLAFSSIVNSIPTPTPSL